MSMNNVFRKEVEESITGNYVSKEDFRITDDEAKSYTSVAIYYNYNSNYKFSFTIQPEITISRSPGSITDYESFSAKNKDDLLRYLRGWIGYLEAEISTTPAIREINAHRSEVNDKFTKIEELLDDMGQENFSKTEAEEIKGRLDALETELRKKIEELIKDKKNQHDEISKLNKEVEFLKIQLDSLPRANWFKALLVKTMNWGARNPEAIKSIGGMARALLQDGKTEIPHELIDLLPSPDSTFETVSPSDNT
jgi:polyhydroxyalkanoate synthesis regulator phasin